MGRRVFRSGRSTARKTGWIGLTPQTTMTAVTGSSAQLLATFTPNAPGETIVRTRGLFGWKSDQQSANEDQMGAVGFGLVSAQAASVGITALPHPDTDASWDGWLWHSYFASSVVFTTGAGFLFDVFNRIMIDSKAMRKVGSDERVVAVVENSNSDGLSVYIGMRLLTKAY